MTMFRIAGACIRAALPVGHSHTFHLSPQHHFQKHYHLYIQGLKETRIISF